ncbi:MAG: FAD binding domain-containing protein [Candidatus Izemoplasmatales bacterium]
MRIENVVRPASAEEAYKVLLADKNAVPIGGGAWIKLTLKEIQTAVLLDGLGLDRIVADQRTVEIGSLATLSAVAEDPVLSGMYGGLLSTTCRRVMGINVQDVATLGGTVMGGYAFSDLLTALLAMDATLRFQKHEPMKLAEYVARKTNFRDLLTAVSIPRRNGRGAFVKIARTRLDFAILNLAVTNVNGLYLIAVGARPGVARLATAAAERLNEIHPVSVFDLEKAVGDALGELDFGSNGRASEEYRRMLAKHHLFRALKEVTFDADPR